MTKYYANGKQISKQEANEIKKKKMQDCKRVQTLTIGWASNG